MTASIILASGSRARAGMLKSAGLEFTVQTPRIDEESIKQALLTEALPPRGVAEALAEIKARRISGENPGSLVVGCDQVLEFAGIVLSKPETPDMALQQLRAMRGQRHTLLSAAVICENGQPAWRNVGTVAMTMRQSTDSYLKSYVTRNWNSIREAVGGYKLEEEGVRLFSDIDGDYFHVLGMPLLELLNYLTQRGVLEP